MNTFPNFVAARTLALLDLRKARLDAAHTSFYVWPRHDRVVLIFDPIMVDTGKINDDFIHRLSTQLQGRRVVRTNSRGLFLQVGYDIPPAMVELIASPLDLSKQPSPYHLPVGSTETGRDLWISLLEGDSFLVAGSRGMGKTGFIHGGLQSLLHGGAVKVYGYDGKGGVEFSRYADHPKFHLVTKLGTTLRELKDIAAERRKLLLLSGEPNILLYNEAHPDSQLSPIAVIVDEAALTTDEEKAGLVHIVERERDTGFYPILATNRPEASALLVKSNLVTRICFPVPSWHASQMVLAQNGAEDLPKVQGRGLIAYQARLIKFQSFVVRYPEPSEDTIRMVLNQKIADEEIAENKTTDESARILELHRQGKKPSAIIREIWGITGGGRYAEKSEQVKAVLSKSDTSSSTSEPEMPQNGLLGTD